MDHPNATPNATPTPTPTPTLMPSPSPRGADAAPHPAKFSEPELVADTLATVCKMDRQTDGEEDREIEMEIEKER